MRTPRRRSRRSTARSTTAGPSASTRPVRRPTTRAGLAAPADPHRGGRPGRPPRPPLTSMRVGGTGARDMTRLFGPAILPIAAFFLFGGAAPSGDDLVFTGGRVVDGTGAAAFRADVAVRGGLIAAVGELAPDRIARARRRIDATGLVVSPGFIDLLGQSEYNALVDQIGRE